MTALLLSRHAFSLQCSILIWQRHLRHCMLPRHICVDATSGVGARKKRSEARICDSGAYTTSWHLVQMNFRSSGAGNALRLANQQQSMQHSRMRTGHSGSIQFSFCLIDLATVLWCCSDDASHSLTVVQSGNCVEWPLACCCCDPAKQCQLVLIADCLHEACDLSSHHPNMPGWLFQIMMY